MRTLILIGLIFVLIFAVRILMRAAPAKSAWFIQRLVWTAGILVFLFLLLTGRLHWLFALILGAIPLLRRALPYLRYAPIVGSLWKRYGGRGNTIGGNGNGNGNTSGQYSTVRSNYIEMTLNHENGAMDGDVLQGQFKGSRLQSMSLVQLLSLLGEVRDDNDSVALLQTYMDHAHHGWREQAQAAGADQANLGTPSSAMTQSEACQILGVKIDADRAEIIAAHKRLIQKIHPDRGGSPYLAAKINQAKDFLLPKRS